MYRAYLSAGWDDPVTHLFSGTAPPERGGYHGLDYSGYCRFIRGYLGYWPEVFSWFFAADAEHYYPRRNGCQCFLLAYAMKSLPAGTAYAVWTGIGAVGTAILGIVLLGESASLARILSLGLILAGIIGLKLAS